MVEVKFSGVLGNIYSQFPKGVRFLKGHVFQSPLYPKGVGLFYQPHFENNLTVLDDSFYRGVIAVLIEGLNKLEKEETPEEERALFLSACQIVDNVVSNPSYRVEGNHKKDYEKIRELGKKRIWDSKEKYDKKEVKQARGRKVRVSKLVQDRKGSLFSAGVVMNETFDLTAGEWFKKQILTLKPILTDELFRAFKEFYLNFGSLACFGYLRNRIFPVGFLYVAGEEKRYYFIKPQNYFFEKKKSVSEIWETALKIEEENGEKDALLELHRKQYEKLFSAVEKYFRSGEFKRKLKELATQKGIETTAEGVIFADCYSRSETSAVLEVVSKSGADGKLTPVGFFRKNFYLYLENQKYRILPLFELIPYQVVGKGIRENGFRTKVKPSFLFSAVVLAGAFYIWSREENRKLVIATFKPEGETNPIEEFYRLVRGISYSLPSFPFQSVNLKNRLNRYAQNNFKLSMTKKTREVVVRTDKILPELEGFIIREETTDYLVSPIETVFPDSPYYGLNLEDLTALKYTVYRFRTAGSKVSLKTVGTGIRLPWGEFSYEGEIPKLDSCPSILLTEVNRRKNAYEFISSLFGIKKKFKDKFIEAKTFPLALIHTKAETITDGYLLYREEMNSLKSVIREALGISEESFNGFLIGLFSPMTAAQQKAFSKHQFITGNGTAFYANLSPSFWAENGNLLTTLFLTLSIYESESVNRGIAKLKDRSGLKRKTYEIKRGGDIFYVGGEYLTAEGTARLIKVLGNCVEKS